MDGKRAKPQKPFRLTMRILADVLERKQLWLEYYVKDDAPCLKNVRFYEKGCEVKKGYVYLVDGTQAEEFLSSYPESRCIIRGDANPAWLTSRCSTIVLKSPVSMTALYGWMQDTFELYEQWDWILQRAAEETNPLDALLEASIPILRNPMIIHDTSFYILSDPHHISSMSKWERDARTGRQMVPMALINDFRTDAEYLNGLRATKPVMYSSNQTGYRILFRNLWNDNHYEGRLLIDEVENSIQPGDFHVLDYLGTIIERLIRQHDINWLSEGKNIENFFAEFLQRGQVEEHQAMLYLQMLGWKKEDHYCALRIVTEEKNFSLISANAIRGQIDVALGQCVSLYYDHSVAVVINLTRVGESMAQMISKLAVIIRESLLKVGISAEMDDFSDLPKAYEQAQIALSYGVISHSTYWYYYFDQYLLDFILNCATRQMPVKLLSTGALQKLKSYDQENHADLYHTLEVYLRLEQNVLQTSKELYIHRSTLAYRLERIRKLTGVDLDDADERLKLGLSYYMERETGR